MIALLMLLALAISSYLLTWTLRRYALSRKLLDVPNARSSHSLPTPRGGGLAIVVTFLAVLPVLVYQGLLDRSLALGMISAGLVVALIGFVDDHGHIAARWRLLAHFVAAALVVSSITVIPPLSYFGYFFDLGWAGYGLAILLLVWMLNLFNFMDGIDGIATVEVVTVSFGGALLYVMVDGLDQAGAALALGAASMGFLIWNFPPAKIFMGDAGSGFLGLMLGALTLHSFVYAPQLFWAWLILLGVFIVDATTTLIVRMIRGIKVYEAHRSHAYQVAARKFGGHLPVTMGVFIINTCWLLPWACSVTLLWVDGALATLISFVPLLVLAIYFKAGQPESDA